MKGFSGMLCLITLIQACSFAQDPAEFKSIHEAAAAGNARGLLAFIQSGVSVNAKDSNGRTPLMSASWSGMSRVLPILLDRGAEIDAIDSDGNTALHLGAAKGDAKVISDLIVRGADVSIKNGKGLLAKELASLSGDPRAVNEFPNATPYGRISERDYEEPIVRADKLRDILRDPNQVKARLLSDPKLVSEMAILSKAMELEETKWTSRNRRIKNTFFTVVRKEIDSEIAFIQTVAKQEDANDIVHELDVIQSTWKRIFSQSSRTMREADRAASAQGMQQGTTRTSRASSRRGATMDTGYSRRPTRSRDAEVVPEVDPHAAYIDSWSSVSDTTLDTVYLATEDKFLDDMGTVRFLAEEKNKTRILNAIDGVMLERRLRGERSLAVYDLTKADLAEVPDAGMNEESARGARSRRGSTQTQSRRR